VIEECLVVEFRVVGDECPLAAASRTTGIAIDARPPQRRADGTVLLRFSAPPDDTLATVLDADDRIRYLHAASAENRTNYRCLATAPCVAHRLTDAGLLAESLRYREGTERHSGAVVGYDVLQDVLGAVGKYNATDPDADRSPNTTDPTDRTDRTTENDPKSGDGDAHTHREGRTTDIEITVERVYPLRSEDDSPVARRFDLTPAQASAIETALGMGYFAVPRECTASDVADALGIGKSAFLERLRRGQARLFAGLFP
jgi:predicted DNA binding protein